MRIASIHLKLCVVLSIVVALCANAFADVEQWGVFEITLTGSADGNPFADVGLSARFSSAEQTIECRGFYDGEGVYRIRFMPPRQGVWRYETRSTRPELAGKTGELTCGKPSAENHGPVSVRDTYHFAYADGTPFVPIGTTSYAWVHQPDELQEQTLTTLESSPFNKLRMCVLPTRSAAANQPRRYPFQRLPDKRFDTTRFDVEFFQHLDKQVARLRDMGIEADLILFHPYDEGQMGFDRMDSASDDRYLRYVVARYSAYRNVWWSLANEFDLMTEKTYADWDRFFQIVQADDPYHHLRSIHFSQRMYDPSRPWVSHVSVQNGLAVADFGRAVLYRQVVAKPIVYDEAHYEGNLPQRWGQLSAEEMVKRFWLGTIAGTYVGHGECYQNPGGPVWLSKGGELRGESPKRIAFLKQILESAPAREIEPIDQFYATRMGGKAGEFYLIYFGEERPTQWLFELPKDGLVDGMTFEVDVLDTWNMTITPVEQKLVVRKHSQYVFRSDPEQKIDLPDGRPYMALRVRRVAP